jgi:hypothetical protein
MSVKQMGMVWDLDLPANKKFVLLAYADHADDEGGSVFPSLARVAYKTGYSRDQVRRISKELREANLMMLVEKATHNRPAEYKLTLERGSILPPLTPRGVGANDPPQVGASVPPEPSVQPSGSRRDADASRQIVKNPFGYYCDVAKALRVTIVPEDREQTSKHFKDLMRLQKPDEEELRRVVSKMLEARTAGTFWSPQKALEKVRGNNVTPLRRNQPSEQMISTAGYRVFE